MEKTRNSNLKQLFDFRLFLLIGLVGTFIYQLNDDFTLLNSTPTQIPFLLKYVLIFTAITIVFISYGFWENEIQNKIASILIPMIVLVSSFFLKKQDFIGALFNKSYFGTIRSGISSEINSWGDFFTAYIMLPTTIFLFVIFLFSSILLIINLGGFFGSSKGYINFKLVLFISGIFILIVTIGILTHYFVQQSFNENFKSYLTQELEYWQRSVAYFAVITLIMIVTNTLNQASLLNDKLEEIEDIKQKLENEYLKKPNYYKNFDRVSSFDKYGLAVTRINKTMNNSEYPHYGLINRFGDIILDNNFQLYKYYDDYRPYTYLKHHKLIIVSEIGKNRMGVVDIYGNWIIDLKEQNVEYPNIKNPSNDAYESHTIWKDSGYIK